MSKIIAPITPVRSSCSPERLCESTGNSCSPVSETKFLFRNSKNTGWTKKHSGTFRSKDGNFKRLINDKGKKDVAGAIKKEIQNLKKMAQEEGKKHRQLSVKYQNGIN